MDFHALLDRMQQLKASDLYLTVGLQPSFRAEKIITENFPPLTQEDIIMMLEQVASQADRDKFYRLKEINLSLVDKEKNRYRINCFFQQQHIGMVVRRMRIKMPELANLNLNDESYKEAIMQPRGLVLVAGPSGSGKTTTIAAMINHRNNYGYGHVVTIEDPIEYVHEHKNCIFTQREIGVDTLSWSEALKNALRQRPDVIFLGEIRERESMENAISFAETGHLCVATIHASSASGAIERIANFFPHGTREQYLYSLAQVVKYIYSQRLVAGKDGYMVPAIEVLRNVGQVKPLIIDGKVQEIREIMQRNSDYGMTTYEKSLITLLNKGVITEETAISEADYPDNMRITLMQSRLNRESYERQPASKTTTRPKNNSSF